MIGGEPYLRIPSVSDCKVINYIVKKFGAFDHYLSDSGRSGILLAIQEVFQDKDNTLWFPYYYCTDVLYWLKNLGYQIAFYHDSPLENEKFLPPAIKANDIVFCIHYFGKINKRFYKWATEKNLDPNYVIEDFTQSLWTPVAKTFGEHLVASLRKWLPIPDGGIYLKKSSKIKADLDKKPSLQAIEFSNLRLAAQALRSTSAYQESLALDLFNEADSILTDVKSPSCISEISRLILLTHNVADITEQRKLNFMYLNNFFMKSEFSFFENITNIAKNQNIVPIFYTFVLKHKKRGRVLKELKKKNIFCPLIWPGIDSKIAGPWTNELICLPIDQRYDLKQMHYICDVFEGILRK